MTITIEKRDGADWVVHSDLDGWARPATPDESALWAHKDARIAELEKALRAYFTFSEELSRLIDDDKDVRALKLALAMAGHRPKYRSDVDEARRALMVSERT